MFSLPSKSRRFAMLTLLIVCLFALLVAIPLSAQDYPTNTPDLVLVPRDSVGTFTDLTPLRDEILNATEDAPAAPTVIYVQPAPDPDGLTVDNILKIGLLILVGFALWVTHRNGITFAQLVPMPLVQEMVKSAANAGVEAGRTYALSTPNKIDDALVDAIGRRVERFFIGSGTPPTIPPPDLPDAHG